MPGERTPAALARRLVPLRAGVVLQGFLLWVPVEKLFQTQIGFNAASIGFAAAAYAAVVPLLEVPSGILADRWSRSKILMVASGALAASSLLGGLSTNVATYIAAAMILGVYFALNSGTIDSIVYDTVLEETGSSDLYEKWIGRVRIAESAAFAVSALAGGFVAEWASPRLTYFLTVPFALASVIAFARFREPRLHRATEPVALRRHVATAAAAMTRVPRVRQVMLLAALAALLSQAVFEFGPLWLVSLHAPAAAFGPYWAALVATGGLPDQQAAPWPPVARSAARRRARGGAGAPRGQRLACRRDHRAGSARPHRGDSRDPRRPAPARCGPVRHPHRCVLRCRHPVLAAVPALLPGPGLAHPRARSAPGRMGADRRHRGPRSAAGRLGPPPPRRPGTGG
jgi:MFS family permease